MDSEMADRRQWEEIQGFRSPGEYSRFVDWISEGLDSGELKEVPVVSRYAGAGVLDEHWYRSAAGEVWRLVAPDFPFAGVFERVPKEG